MFSKELENLINATLEDGVLEEYEKAALVKRAQAEGVDLTELEIYINSILQRRKKERTKAEEARQEIIDKKKEEAYGRVCPNCGKQVNSMTLKCDCGYEFTNTAVRSSVEILADKIEKITNEASRIRDEEDREKKKTKEIVDVITIHPVPNTKEDIIEFCAMAISNSKTRGGLWGTILGRIKILAVIAVIGAILAYIIVDDPEMKSMAPVIVIIGTAFYGGIACTSIDQDTIRSNKIANAWRAKFEQVLIKGRSLRGDAEFTRQLDYFESLINDDDEPWYNKILNSIKG